MFNVNIPLPSPLQRAAEEVQPMTEFSAATEKTRGGKGVRNKRRGLEEEEVVLSEPSTVHYNLHVTQTVTGVSHISNCHR